MPARPDDGVTTVALIGPDGAGKSSVIPRVAVRLGVPVRGIYMGVNLEASRLMLPTTRVALELKRRRGGRPDMVGATGNAGGQRDDAAGATGSEPPDTRRRGPLRELRSGLRLANWMAEEWFRQGVAWANERRGRVVLFDRHFFCDYYANDVAGRRPGRPWTSRLHGAMLERLYPRPDLVILLDAPAEVLFARKGEGSVASLEKKRLEYLELRPTVKRFVVVDATRDVEAVVEDVVAAIRDELAATTERRDGGRADADDAIDGSVATSATTAVRDDAA
jgi:Thymidylate kinase